MSRTKLRVQRLVALSILAGALPAAYAQDAPGSPPAATTSSTPAQTPPADPGAAGAQSQSATGSDTASKPQSQVCFKLTMRCVDAKAAKGKSGSASKDAPAAQQPLNLSAPDIRTVVPPEELKEPLPSNEQVSEEQEADTVQVKGDSNAPNVPGGFGALWWAVNHPAQAWRIFTPAE